MTDESGRQTREFSITRVLDAPRALVFQSWIEPKRLAHWFFNPEQPIPPDPIIVDLRVGGAWRVKMVESEQNQYFTGGVYHEIVPGKKLVFTWGAADGWPEIDADHPEADAPVVTILFNPVGAHEEKTEMVFHLTMPAHLSDERVNEWFAFGIRGGWRETIDRLVALYPNVA